MQYCAKVLSHLSFLSIYTHLILLGKWIIGYCKNRVCTFLMWLKVNIWCNHLHSSTYPELSQSSFHVISLS